MLSLMLLLSLLQLPDAEPPKPTHPSSPWTSTADLEILTDERDSLRGVSRVVLTVNVPESLTEALPSAPLQSMLTLLLDQAGIAVVQQREIEVPVLAVNVHVVTERDERGADTGWMAYRVYADLMQLVRLADHGGKARVMLASTWHAGSHGVASSKESAELQARVRDVIDAFLADHRAANAPPSSVPPRLIR